MSYSDFHDKPFDESTKTKLHLFSDYLTEWLPVFISPSNPSFKNINIFDFFAGPGKDKKGTKGSPLLILKIINEYKELIQGKDIILNLFFNDAQKSKIETLKKVFEQYKPEYIPISVNFTSLDFRKAFDSYYPVMKKSNSANLLFLDQKGIKHIDKEIFRRLISLKTTDFLFFVSSSTINRFTDVAEIKQYIEIPSKDINDHYEIHRLVTNYYRSLISSNTEFYLAPFSIKKGSNIYGLIFGSSHLLGLKKFLEKSWKLDRQRGEANFDIDRDNINPVEPSLFSEFNKPSKLKLFENELKENILNGTLKTNLEMINFTYTSSFLPKHTRQIVNSMIRDKLLPEQQLRISYEAYNNNKVDRIKLSN